MKRLHYLILAIAVLTISMGACKTNEANYRDAYEKAMAKQTDTGDSLTTAQLRQSQNPRMQLIAGSPDTLPVMTFAITKKADAGSDEGVKKFCIVVGRFKQIFNARSMCERLATSGYPDACVVHDRMNYYYVIATSTNQPEQIKSLLNKCAKDSTLVLRPPFPYVLRPAHLVR